jgi:hypothetical protein
MKRNVFVGSSAEAVDKAQQICDLLCRQPNLGALLWTEVFRPGYLTFEALESMLLECCAAVFVATPDDLTSIRGNQVRVPRANIMLEFGLVAGRMGLHNIALCQYGDATLPSDLRGLTTIVMDPPSDCADVRAFKKQAARSLALWSSRLVATADQVARTEIVHGYTGRWDFSVDLTTWRDFVVPKPGYVCVKGCLDLVLPAGRGTGHGLAHGALYFHLPSVDGHSRYEGEYLTAHGISNAVCLQDGSLEMITEAFALQLVRAQGKAPPELSDVATQPEPWSARWLLTPGPEPRTLRGEVRTEGAIKSVGSATITKCIREL